MGQGRILLFDRGIVSPLFIVKFSFFPWPFLPCIGNVVLQMVGLEARTVTLNLDSLRDYS